MLLTRYQKLFIVRDCNLMQCEVQVVERGCCLPLYCLYVENEVTDNVYKNVVWGTILGCKYVSGMSWAENIVDDNTFDVLGLTLDRIFLKERCCSVCQFFMVLFTSIIKPKNEVPYSALPIKSTGPIKRTAWLIG